MLLDGGFGKEEASTYLRVSEPFYDKLQNLSLASREGIEIRQTALVR